MKGKATVIGFGAMGSGIAEYLAISGFTVNIYEVSDGVYENSIVNVNESLAKLSKKGILDLPPDKVVGRIVRLSTLDESVDKSELVIEAVNEEAELKLSIIRQVSHSVSDDTLIVSNTSSIPISYLQQDVNKPDRVAGLHWFNPPVLMKLIEIVKGSQTSDKTVERLSSVVNRIGKEYIVAKKDVRGFIANRVIRALRYHAFLLYFDRKYSAEQIDSTLMYKVGLPMGIFALTDFTGGIKIENDESITYDRMKNMFPEYEPSIGYDLLYRKVIQKMEPFVKEGKFGVRSGNGFYAYPLPGKWVKPDISKDAGKNIDPVEILGPVYNEALFMIHNNICTIEDIDRAMKLGFNWPIDLFEYFNSKVDKVNLLKTLNHFSTEYPDLENFYSYQGE